MPSLTRGSCETSVIASKRRRARRQLESIHRKLFVRLVNRARWKHRLSTEDAKDIVQEAFVMAVVKIGSVENTRAWLEGVVDRLAMNHRRTQERRSRLLAIFGPAGDRAASSPEEG